MTAAQFPQRIDCGPQFRFLLFGLTSRSKTLSDRILDEFFAPQCVADRSPGEPALRSATPRPAGPHGGRHAVLGDGPAARQWSRRHCDAVAHRAVSREPAADWTRSGPGSEI